MDKVYYYSRITKQCVQKISDIDYHKVFPYISWPDNICNKSDAKTYEEESSSNDYADYSGHNFFISNLCNKREKHCNNDFAATGWILCVITHIGEDVLKNSQNNHHIKVNTFIKSLFTGLTEK